MKNERVQKEAPFCECGCGQRVKTNKNGIWSRWRAGHQYKSSVRRVVQSTPNAPLRLLRNPLPECDEEV